MVLEGLEAKLMEPEAVKEFVAEFHREINRLTAETRSQIDAKRRPSGIADDVGIANYRTSETCDLDWRDPAVADVERKISELLGIPLDASEPPQGQRYAPGQELYLAVDNVADAKISTGKTADFVDSYSEPRTFRVGFSYRR